MLAVRESWLSSFTPRLAGSQGRGQHSNPVSHKLRSPRTKMQFAVTFDWNVFLSRLCLYLTYYNYKYVSNQRIFAVCCLSFLQCCYELEKASYLLLFYMLFRLRIMTAISVVTDHMNWGEDSLLVTLLYFLSLGDNTLIKTRKLSPPHHHLYRVSLIRVQSTITLLIKCASVRNLYHKVCILT